VTSKVIATPERVQLDRYFYRVKAIKRSSDFAQVWLLERSGDSPPQTIYDRQRAAKTFDNADEASVVNELSNWILLHHKNVLPLIKIVRLNFRIAALMELRKGTLQDVLEQRTLTWNETRTILLQVCEALRYAYEKHNLAHLDIKPANVLVKAFPNQVQVSDWGISRLAEKGRIVGGGFTPGYLAPERLTGESVPGPSSDIFAFGMLAIIALTGMLPYAYLPDEDKFGSRSEQVFLQLHNGTYFKNAGDLLKPLPSHIQKLLLSCVHPDPSARQSDYGRLLHAITGTPG
jgi:serine/threonine protein kinase